MGRAEYVPINVRCTHGPSRRIPREFPGATTAPGPTGCCSTEDQYVYATNPSLVAAAGLTIGNLSTIGLWHYPAAIIDATTTTPFLEFAPNTEFDTTTVAGILQNFGGREQMVVFLMGGSWSSTTNYIGDIWFNWGYQGQINSSASVPTSAATSVTTTSSLTSNIPSTTTGSTSTTTNIALTSPLSVFTTVYSGYCIPYNNTISQDYDYGYGPLRSTLPEPPDFLCAQYCCKGFCKGRG
jgi:hypothetical protein